MQKSHQESISIPQSVSDLAKKLTYATPGTAPFVPGRRSFFKYRDLGVTAASDGIARAQVTCATDVMQQTGWHYHICDVHFIYTLRGWIELEFEDGRTIRVETGESLYIPPGLKHNEIAISPDLELFEMSVPAKMETVPCERPSHLPVSL
ncbi:cupin domain-containing protein [Pseudomonas putida]|uniref:cupin domain-containing protein n=1 Tax=Pseudomonas putida TaxID=303 RepID=UPI0018A94437|nr:cupin domain-containing protein [Pseudomonas putida]MBF8668359.1 cupin domain-containing protein [Pseudomonas putida]MBF8710822.1 cupin domain-containing protein [Pseudomonas putida]